MKLFLVCLVLSVVCLSRVVVEITGVVRVLKRLSQTTRMGCREWDEVCKSSYQARVDYNMFSDSEGRGYLGRWVGRTSSSNSKRVPTNV
jgi:hypothetical protein